MKPIRGSVVSSKPVSLSKAASILSRFAASETGAPQEVSAFLRRTSEAFGELVKFRRDLRAGQEGPSFRGAEEVESTRRKKKKKKEEAGVEAARDQDLAEIDGNPGTSSGFQRGVAPGILGLTETEGGSREKRKKKRRRVAEGIEGGVGNAVEVESEKSDGGEGKRKDTVEDVKERAWGEENVENHRERSRKKKRKKEEDLKEGNGDAVENYVERHHKKKRKVKQES